MSLVKFTELPSGSIQGGDVLAVAGASSYKVTAVEYANWSNKRIQGNTDKTIENAYKFAESNDRYIAQVINPQLGQIGTNKADIANLRLGVDSNGRSIIAGDARITANSVYGHDTRAMIHGSNTSSYDNQPSIIASLIRNDNFIKNPAAQHIGLYWKNQIGSDPTVAMVADLLAKNLEYPGWSRTGDLLTYNVTVALDGQLTIGQLGGNNAENLEYRVNGGAWDKVGNGGIKSIGVGYVGSTAGAQISVRMHKDSGGIAFAIPSPAYWTTDTGVRDPNIRLALEKLTYGLRRKRIDLVACGYWFAQSGNNSSREISIFKPSDIGFVSSIAIWEYDVATNDARAGTINWGSTLNNTLRITDRAWNDGYVFAATDPNLYTQAEVYD